MATKSILARLEAIEQARHEGRLEILNPRWFPGECDGVTEAEHERQNAARVAAAERDGRPIIRIQPARVYA